MNKRNQSISLTDEGFPSRLHSIPNPPSILYYLGDISLINAIKLIAIIGTRTPTPEGIVVCQIITRWFVERGYYVVSGLARGIDTVAHETCLKYGGKTIAILPSGIGNIYPPENIELSERIVNSGGLLISEYPENSSPRKSYFVQRDRLQSGLSLGVIVIETEIHGGTMHTGNFAIKQNRILGCVEFSHDLENQSIRSGNRLLLSRGNAFGINRKNLVDFEKMLRPSV
jgi:DNA processing protein